jgi:hypothetical protein
MIVLVLVFGNVVKGEKLDLYDLLRWANNQKKSHPDSGKKFDKILIVDKHYNKDSDLVEFNAEDISVEEFKPTPDSYYCLALNLSNKSGIVRVMRRLLTGNVPYEFGFITKEKGYRQEPY